MPAAPRAEGMGAEIPVGVGEFGAILRRRWKTIAITTALVTSLGAAFLGVVQPQFTASTMLFVDPRNRPSFQIEGTGIGGSFDPNLVDSQIVIIESDAVLQRVISREKLHEDPEFARGPGDVNFNVLRNLKEAVKVKRPDRTYVVEVQVRTRSGEKSARIANAIAQAYMNDGRESKNETAQREETWLDTHLKDLMGRLKEAEARVEAYKVENRILGVEGKLVGEQQLSELNRGIVDAQRKAAEAKATLDQVEEIRRSGKIPDTTNDALRSAVIERLRSQLSEVLRLEANARSTLGPRHPAFAEIREQIVETRRQINEELNRIADGARAAHNVAKANVVGLERQLDALKRDANSTNKTLLRLRELERAVEAQKAVYEKFLRDKEQIARLSVDTPAGRVIAPALAPQRASFPNKALILAVAFVAGLFAGVALALVLETLSPSGHRPRQPLAPAAPPGPIARRGNRMANADPSLPLLAVLPSGHGTGGARASQRRFGRTHQDGSLLAEPGSAYADEMAGLAEAILARLPVQPLSTLLVSGLGRGGHDPGVTLNLAVALAERGESVLVVDGRGGAESLSRLVPLTRQPMIVDLQGQARLAYPVAGLTDLPVLVLPFAAEVPRTTARMPQQPHSFVIIDGPPAQSRALAEIDLTRHVDGVIGILPSGGTPDAATAATFDRAFGPALLGFVGQAA